MNIRRGDVPRRHRRIGLVDDLSGSVVVLTARRYSPGAKIGKVSMEQIRKNFFDDELRIKFNNHPIGRLENGAADSGIADQFPRERRREEAESRRLAVREEIDVGLKFRRRELDGTFRPFIRQLRLNVLRRDGQSTGMSRFAAGSNWSNSGAPRSSCCAMNTFLTTLG
jgi:hypothetical protein